MDLLSTALRLEFAHEHVRHQVCHELVPKPARMDLIRDKQLHEARFVPWRELGSALGCFTPAVQLAQLATRESFELVRVAHVVGAAAERELNETVCPLAGINRKTRGVKLGHLVGKTPAEKNQHNINELFTKKMK